MADNNDNKILNVPNLRFPEFKEKWKRVTLGDITKGFDYGMNAAAKSFDGNNKYIRITDIDEVSSQYRYDNVVSPDGKLEDHYMVKENDILLARTGASTGKSYLYHNSDGKLYFAGFLIRVNIYKHNPYFIFSQLHIHRYWRWIFIMSARSGQPGINSQEYASFPVYTASLQEEDKIATFLKSLDERIATQNKIIVHLESLIKGLNNHLQLLYSNEISTSFNELGEDYSGLSGKSADDFGEGKTFVTYLNVYSNLVIDSNAFFYVDIKENERQNRVKSGDALFTLSSETPDEVGVGAIYLGDDKELYLNSFCFGIHFKENKVVPEYLPYFFDSRNFRKFVYPLAQGSTRYNLHKPHFMSKKFSLPNIEHQKKMASILVAMSEKLNNEKEILQHLQTQKKYLLSRMFI